MNLVLQREKSTQFCTLGSLSIDGKFECYTLEDVVRKDGVKIHGETAIPAGTYSIDLTFSPRFTRVLPLLVNVAGFVGIRIHPGNTAADTEGCLLVGTSKGINRVDNSRIAFNSLFLKLESAKGRKEAIQITVRNA